MNKQLTKKTIGIAASAALMASVAFSSNALAAKGGNPKASIGVDSWCEIKEADEEAGWMTVHVRVTDKSSGVAAGMAMVESVDVQGMTKVGGTRKGRDNDLDPIEGASADATAKFQPIDGTYKEVRINLCGGELGKAINAETLVLLAADPYPPSKSTGYTAQCGNDPVDGILGNDDDVIIGGLKTADYPDLCKTPPVTP